MNLLRYVRYIMTRLLLIYDCREGKKNLEDILYVFFSYYSLYNRRTMFNSLVYELHM